MASTIVFLPGVMASRLEWTDGSGRVWDPDSHLQMIKWVFLGVRGGELLARAVHSLTPARVLEEDESLSQLQQRRGWAGVMGSAYHSLLGSLEGSGQDVFAVGYDWRQDVRTQ